MTYTIPAKRSRSAFQAQANASKDKMFVRPKHVLDVRVSEDIVRGNQMIKMRRYLNLSRVTAAQLLGISVATLRALENGKLTCGWDDAERRLREGEITLDNA